MLKNKIDSLKIREQELTLELVKKREEIVHADGPKESAGISATRWILEDIIQLKERELAVIKSQIKELSKIANYKINKSDKLEVGRRFKVEIDEKKTYELLLTETIDSVTEGLISVKSGLGKECLNKKKGEQVEYEIGGENHRAVILELE